MVIMDRIIRRELEARGHDPDALIARNIEVYEREEARINKQRKEYVGEINTRFPSTNP